MGRNPPSSARCSLESKTPWNVVELKTCAFDGLKSLSPARAISLHGVPGNPSFALRNFLKRRGDAFNAAEVRASHGAFLPATDWQLLLPSQREEKEILGGCGERLDGANVIYRFMWTLSAGFGIQQLLRPVTNRAAAVAHPSCYSQIIIYINLLEPFLIFRPRLTRWCWCEMSGFPMPGTWRFRANPTRSWWSEMILPSRPRGRWESNFKKNGVIDSICCRCSCKYYNRGHRWFHWCWQQLKIQFSISCEAAKLTERKLRPLRLCRNIWRKFRIVN